MDYEFNYIIKADMLHHLTISKERLHGLGSLTGRFHGLIAQPRP